MIRATLLAFIFWSVATSAWAQAQPAPATAAAQTVTPVAKKSTPKTKPARMPAPTENGPCGLGVIVAVGEEFEVQRIGIASVERKDIPISNWGLGDLVFARVRAATAPGIAVRRIHYSEAAFPVREAQKGLLFRDMKAELIDRMRQITSGSNCQRYVLVGRSISPFSSSGQSVSGVGIVKWYNPLRNQPYLYALSFIRVFDGRDLTVIRQSSAMDEYQPLLSRILVGTLILGPHRELNEASFPSIPTEAVANPAFRDGVRAMLRASLDKTLPAMLR